MQHSGLFAGVGAFATGVFLSVQLALAQAHGIGAGPSSSSRVGPNSSEMNTIPATTPSPDTVGADFLSGKVMMDDGSAPPEPVVVEQVCGNERRAGVYTDSKGRFSFQPGQGEADVVDEDASFGPGANRGNRGAASADTVSADSRLINCDLRAVLPGYRSDVVDLADQRYMDTPDVGTIILHRLADVEGSTISATSLEAPEGR